MPISITNYVNITSGVGAGLNVPQRDLIGRFFTNNELIGPDEFLQFTNSADVLDFFGPNAEETARAQFYFSWISKTVNQPAAIQFARYVAPFSSTQSGDILSTFFTITGLTSTVGLTVGDLISGTGIQALTVIASIDSATQVTMSLAATATGTETITFNNLGTAPDVSSDPTNILISIPKWVLITNGSFGITIDDVVLAATGLNFSTVATYQDVATILQTAVQTGTGPMFQNATVTYFTDGVHNGFTFTGGIQKNATISVQGGLGGTDLTTARRLAWLPAALPDSNIGAPTNPGALLEPITTTLDDSVTNSNNFGSFMFLNNINLDLPDAVLVAQWNLEQNNTYLFCAPVTSSNYLDWTTNTGGLSSYGGTALTLSGLVLHIQGTLTSASATITELESLAGLAVGNPISGTNIPLGAYILAINAGLNTITMSVNASGSATETISFTPWQFPEQIPMMIEAATNYETGINSVQNYMFQNSFAGLIPRVTTDADKTKYDAVRVNYYGQTQTAGQPINFYQNGVLQGASPSPLDMNTYVNEIWLKDACTAAIMNLLLNLTQLPANAQGVSQILTSLQVVINQALLNGTISVNKALNVNQQQFITAATNDPDAWYQVQTIGYWVNAEIVPSGSNPVIYTATYTLIYAKDDVVRLVTGQDILI